MWRLPMPCLMREGRYHSGSILLQGTGWDNPEFKALFGKSPWKSRWHMLAFDLGHVGLFIIPLLLCVKLWCK